MKEEIISVVNESEHQEYKGDSSLELITTERIRRMSVPVHIRGYKYLRTSIVLSVKNPDLLDAVTKQLYPEVAKIHSTTWQRVERAIRHAIDLAWERGDEEVLYYYFGYTKKENEKSPTNSAFIATIADDISLKLKSEGKL